MLTRDYDRFTTTIVITISYTSTTEEILNAVRPIDTALDDLSVLPDVDVSRVSRTTHETRLSNDPF